MSTSVHGMAGRPGKSPETDERGRAEFSIPLEERFTLKSVGGPAAEPREVDIPVFHAPESREISLDLSTEADLRCVGRVVDAETRIPLANARVFVARRITRWTPHGTQATRSLSMRDDATEVAVDHDGYFSVLAKSWSGKHLEVTAPGYGLALRRPVVGHGTRSDPLEVRLTRSAEVAAVVLANAQGPLSDVRVSLWTDLYRLAQSDSTVHGLFLGDVEWNGTTERDGRCVIRDLPAGVPLTLIYSKADQFERVEPTPVVLQPGERRTVEVRVGAGATVSGVLLNENQRGVPRAEIWMKPAYRAVSYQFESYDDENVRTTTTGEAGQFALDDVADGLWWVGPSPNGPFISLAQAVRVVDGVSDQEVVLNGHKGLRVSGVVFDPAGNPAKGVQVVARNDDPRIFQYGSTDEHGAYSVGALLPGTVSVVAMAGMEGGHGGSERVQARAGDEHVDLYLRAAGAIQGVLRDAATGAPLPGEVMIVPAGALSEYQSWRIVVANDVGEFSCRGIVHQDYDVVGITSDGMLGIRRDVTVVAGLETSDISVDARPAAGIRVRYVGSEPYVRYRVIHRGTLVGSSGVERSGTSQRVVPPGVLKVECMGGNKWMPDEVHEVTLSVGEETEVVFGKKE